MTPHTTYSVGKPIFRFFQRCKTQRENADLTDTSKSSVNRTMVNFKKKTGSIGPKPRTMRRPKANERSIRKSLRMATICPLLSARQLKNDWTDGHLYIVDGVRKVLNKYGLNRRVAPKNIKVTASHRLLRKIFLYPQTFQNGSQPANQQLDPRRQEFVWRPK